MPRPNKKNTAVVLKRDGRKYRSLNITATEAEMNEIKAGLYTIRGAIKEKMSLADITRCALLHAVNVNRLPLIYSIKKDSSHD